MLHARLRLFAKFLQVRRCLPRQSQTVSNDADLGLALLLSNFVVVLNSLLTEFVTERPIVRGHGVVRGALKDREVLCLFGDYGYSNCRRAGTDDSYLTGREIHAFSRPITGVEYIIKLSAPLICGVLGTERQPVAITQSALRTPCLSRLSRTNAARHHGNAPM